MNKVEARETGLFLRRNLPNEIKQEKDEAINKALIEQISHCSMVGLYMAKKEEVSLQKTILYCWKNNIRICVPKVEKNTLAFYEIHSMQDVAPGAFSVLEPTTKKQVSLQDLDVLVVPGVAFDFNYNRVGYGKGYYDTVLKDVKKRIGVCYKEQMFDCIDVEEHDIKVDEMIVK